MKTRLIIITILISLFTLTSCKSKEEKVIDKLSSLSERIEKHGNDYDADDWEEALEDLADIHEDMQDCEFTKEQLKQLGKAEGKLSAIIMKEGSKALGHSFSDAIRNFGSFASGFKEGAEENISEEDFEEQATEISNALKAVEQELNK